MKRLLGVLIALAVIAGAVVGVAYYENKLTDNSAVLLPAQSAVLQSPVCKSTQPGERVACQINTYLVQRSIGGRSIHFDMRRAPGNEHITVDVDCTRRFWFAGGYTCRAQPAVRGLP